MNSSESTGIAPASSGNIIITPSSPASPHDEASQPKAPAINRNRGRHWLDTDKFPGGEVACGCALTYAQFQTKATREPREVTCQECRDALRRQGKLPQPAPWQ